MLANRLRLWVPTLLINELMDLYGKGRHLLHVQALH